MLAKAGEAHCDNGAKVKTKGHLGPAAQRKVPAVLAKAEEDVHPAHDDGEAASAPVQPCKEGVPQNLSLHTKTLLSDSLTSTFQLNRNN